MAEGSADGRRTRWPLGLEKGPCQGTGHRMSKSLAKPQTVGGVGWVPPVCGKQEEAESQGAGPTGLTAFLVFSEGFPNPCHVDSQALLR